MDVVDKTDEVNPDEHAIPARDLQSALESIVREASSVRLRRFEGGSLADARRDCLGTMRHAVANAIEILGTVLERYEPRNDDGPPPEPAKDVAEPADRVAMAGHEYYRDLETVLSHEEGPIRITDLAFMARWELKAQVASLRELATETRLWTIVAECGAARRKLTKSLTAVEIAIAAFEGGESLLEPHYRTERQRALETRRAYARLRQELRRLPEFDDTTGIANLRVAGIAIAVLVGQEIYDDLRISDRIQLRGIQQRILEHLREDIERRGNTRSNDAAQRTFQDLVTCTDLFLQVNQRTELVEHDKALIDAAVRELERLGPDGAVSEEWIARARGLVGRDAVIDELLRTESSDGDAWRAALECARAGLTAV